MEPYLLPAQIAPITSGTSGLLQALLDLFDAYDNAPFTDDGKGATTITSSDEWPLIAAYEAALPLVDAYRKGKK